MHAAGIIVGGISLGGGATTDRLQRDTILVVEDHPPLRGLVAEALHSAGYRVVEVWNGQQAIAALDEHLPPDGQLCLVLLDLRLPYVSGLEVLRHLVARQVT